MREGIDCTILRYEVRQKNMALIEQACQGSGIDAD